MFCVLSNSQSSRHFKNPLRAPFEPGSEKKQLLLSEWTWLFTTHYRPRLQTCIERAQWAPGFGQFFARSAISRALSTIQKGTVNSVTMKGIVVEWIVLWKVKAAKKICLVFVKRTKILHYIHQAPVVQKLEKIIVITKSLTLYDIIDKW